MREWLCTSLKALIPLALVQAIHGQVFQLETGDSAVETTSINLAAVPLGSDLRLQFDFGFSTSETIQPGLFADSITFTLSSVDQIAYLATTDVNGTIFGPNTPGGISLDPSIFQFTEIAYPDATFATSFAYSFSLSIPEELRGVPMSLGFSLFNNQDALGSEAFLRNPTIVPEPGVAALVALGLGVVGFFSRRF